MIAAALGEVPQPTRVPAVDAARADLAGNLWLRRVSSRVEETTNWVVVDRTGKTIATARLPAGLSPVEIGVDYILGVVRDEDRIERVVLHTLRR
jgi:hypothetical protein